MQAQHARFGILESLGDVLREVSRRTPSFGQRSGADREVAQQFDVNKASTPRTVNGSASDELTNGKMRVQAMPGLVPLGNPDVGERIAADALAQLAKERAKVSAYLLRLVTSRAPISQSPQAVQPVSSAVTTQVRASTAACFCC